MPDESAGCAWAGTGGAGVARDWGLLGSGVGAELGLPTGGLPDVARWGCDWVEGIAWRSGMGAAGV
jgi:hypothetical protein